LLASALSFVVPAGAALAVGSACADGEDVSAGAAVSAEALGAGAAEAAAAELDVGAISGVLAEFVEVGACCGSGGVQLALWHAPAAAATTRVKARVRLFIGVP
jgi:hypothetical protein